MLAMRTPFVADLDQIVAFPYETICDERAAAFDAMNDVKVFDPFLHALAHAFESFQKLRGINRTQRKLGNTISRWQQIAHDRASFIACGLDGYHPAASERIKHDLVLAGVSPNVFAHNIPRFARPILVPHVHRRVRFRWNLPIDVFKSRHSNPANFCLCKFSFLHPESRSNSFSNLWQSS